MQKPPELDPPHGPQAPVLVPEQSPSLFAAPTQVMQPRSDDAYLVGKVMDVGKLVAETIADANVRAAQIQKERDIEVALSEERVSAIRAKLDKELEAHRIDADKATRADREKTVRVVVPMSIFGLFIFLGVAAYTKETEAAVKALPQLVVAFTLLALLWQLQKRKKRTEDDDAHS